MKNDRQNATAERFLGLLRPIERDLESYCRRLIFNPDDVADAIQNAVVRAYRAFDRYHDDASFRGWMFKILTNEAFALNRKHSRIAKFERSMEAEGLDALAVAGAVPSQFEVVPSWEILSEALDQDLVTALQALNENERAVLLLRAIGSLRYHEIAAALGTPLGTVMGTLSRARRKMQAAIVAARRRAAP